MWTFSKTGAALILAVLVTAPASAGGLCGAPIAHSVEHRYIVRARVRPLLFWTGRREVGGAWFDTRATADNGRRMQLLIGTDPDRAPMKINRWGYVAETICGDAAELLGLMTESSEQTIEQAQASTDTSRASGQVFKAIRGRSRAGTAETEVLSVSPGRPVTYRDLDAVLAQLPAARTPKAAAVPPGTDSGFLVAVTGLIHDSAGLYRTTGQARTGLRRSYVYSGRLYDLTLRASEMRNGALESDFQIRNRATGSTTDFRVAYAATGPDAEVPVRIVYLPRWWLELELQLAPAS
jgi:hypothetical protein